MKPEHFFKECVKNQVFPRNDAEKQVLLSRIMQDFEEGKTYSEEEINKIIKKYFEDFALIRRELVNFGYMQRSPGGVKYKVLKKQLSKEDIAKITKLARHLEDIS